MANGFQMSDQTGGASKHAGSAGAPHQAGPAGSQAAGNTGTSAYDVLVDRGFVSQVTDEAVVREMLERTTCSFYCGFDPTGRSLHVGHMVPLYAMAHLSRAGHKAIALVGGATAQIGDPSGKTEMRRMLDTDEIDSNAEAMGGQIRSFLRTVHADAQVVNNAQWLRGLNYIEFLRDIGKHFSVNRMLSFETYKMRLETGLSFIEFNYQLLQSYDYLSLHRDYGVDLQLGGDDQWGNIVAGIDLIRRVEGDDVQGITFPLVTRADGRKMGKSEQGAMFLDPELCTPYDFFQYWRNVPDPDVARFLKLYTFLPLEEITELTSVSGSALNTAKERLAWEVTTIAHGGDEADRALSAARAAFGGAGSDSSREGVPATDMDRKTLEEGIGVVDLFVETGLSASKGEARRLIRQGGAYINGEKVSAEEVVVTGDMVENGEILLRAGKKRFHRVLPS
ncbi:MAG: tyrosine--tRNA ligase [Spirochaetia bacterium]